MSKWNERRRARLEQLRERFVAASLQTRTLRLSGPTRTGALDLSRLARKDPGAYEAVLAGLGKEEKTRVALCDLRPQDRLEPFAADVSTLAHAAREQWLESGTQDLAIGWPFIEGKTRSGTWLRAPLLLYPVNLETSKVGRLQWLLEPAGAPSLNEPLVELLAREESIRPQMVDAFGANEAPAPGQKSWAALRAYLEGLGLVFEATPEELPEIEAVERIDREDRQGLEDGVFRLRHHLVVGRFPVSGSTVVADYDALLAGSLEADGLGLANELLLVDEDAPWEEQVPLEDVEDGVLGDGVLGAWRRWQVFASDDSQDAVFRFVENAGDGAGLVVQGPPGTGKSQLITNLVGAAVARGERVLVVCAKRAALDVVAARLAGVGLEEPIAVVHDVGRDRNEVCTSIDTTLGRLDGEFIGAPVNTEPSLRPRREHAQALGRLGARLEHSFEAFKVLAVADGGQPCLAELQERALDDDGRTLPDLRRVVQRQGKVSREEVFATLPRLESVVRRTSTIALPHPLGFRGQWEGYGDDAIAELIEKLDELEGVAEELHGIKGATMTPAESAAYYEVWDRVAPFVDMLEYEKALFEEFLLFWTWMDGEAEQGEWYRVMAVLEQAREELAPVPYELIVRPRADLEGWLEELAELEGLQGRWHRFFRGRFWKLRGLPGRILDICPSLGASDGAMPVDVAGLCRQALRWQDLIAALPPEDLLFDFGFSGQPEEIDRAIESLKRQHTHTRCLHDLHQGLATRGAPYETVPALGLETNEPLQEVPSLRAAVADRAMARGRRRIYELLEILEAKGGLDGDLCEGMRQACDRGDLSAILEPVRLLKQARAEFPVAIEIDTLLADMPQWARAFLKGWRPGKDDFSSASDEAIRAMERAWHGNLLGAKSWDEIDAPLVDEDYLGRLSADLRRCRQVAGLGTHALYLERLAEAATVDERRRGLQQLAGQVRKRRNRPSLRQLTEQFWHRGLALVRPVWFCSPEAVSALFPMEAGFFDLVIFDEASQCPVESALPALVRSKTAVIAGDDQQMPPSRFFQARFEAEEEESTLLDTPSILELSRAVFRNTTLRWHYRSRHEELIAFSNEAFYGGRLITAPVAEQKRDDAIEGLHLCRVDGLWQDQTNLAEAETVIELLARFLVLKSFAGEVPSVGIIAFNRRQAELCESLIDARAATDPVFRQALIRDGERSIVDQLFVRNLENVQGDERDLIIMTMGYGPSEPGGRVHARFGPLGLEGGEKRLNVAMTRARLGLHLVTSMASADLEVHHTRHVGPKLLKSYLAFAEAHVSKDRAMVLRRLEEAASLGGGRGVTGQSRMNLQRGQDGQGGPGTRVRRELAEALVKMGLIVDQDIGLGSQSLDLTVRRNPDEPARLGIDCTGFLNQPDTLSRDVHSLAFWQRLGWTVLRVSPGMWLHDRQRTLDRIAEIQADARV